MALTGFQLGKDLDRKTNQAYTNYIDNTKKNRIFKEALIRVCEQKYNVNDTQKTRDELSFIVKTNKVFGINNNQISIAALQIVGVTIVGTLGTFTTFLPHNLITGQSVTTSGILGFTTNPNGTFLVSVTSTTTFTAQVTTSSGTYTANTGKVTYSNMISDYWHLLAVKASFTKPLYGITISGATNANPIVLSFSYYNSLRTYQQVTISGVGGNTAANGTYFLKKISPLKAALYTDIDLQTPVAGNGAYTSGGLVSDVFYNYCRPYLSAAKIGVLNIPEEDVPMFEIADNMVKVYPIEKTCAEITVDYVKIPDKIIDVAENVTDLTLYYPEKFLELVLEEACLEASDYARDMELRNTTSADIQQNQ